MIPTPEHLDRLADLARASIAEFRARLTAKGSSISETVWFSEDAWDDDLSSEDDDLSSEDAEFIAACSPAVILSLIESARRGARDTARLDGWQSEVFRLVTAVEAAQRFVVAEEAYHASVEEHSQFAPSEPFRARSEAYTALRAALPQTEE